TLNGRAILHKRNNYGFFIWMTATKKPLSTFVNNGFPKN
ncbi:MAG: hypothetical protein ACI8XB_002986, partial [Patiriisocius sp.]